MKKLLFHPFEDYTEKKLLIFGGLLLAAMVYLATLFSIRYDGAIDVHLVTNVVPLKTAIIDNSIAIVTLVTFLFIAGKINNVKTRIVDILVTVLVARVPFLFIMPFNYNKYMSTLSTSLIEPENIKQLTFENSIVLGVFGIFTLLIVVWFFCLLWNGFKTATHNKGKMGVLYFIIAILLAEISSKYATVLFTSLI